MSFLNDSQNLHKANKINQLAKDGSTEPMFVERKVSSTALLTLLVGWHARAVNLPPGDVILARLACPLNDIIVCLRRE